MSVSVCVCLCLCLCVRALLACLLLVWLGSVCLGSVHLDRTGRNSARSTNSQISKINLYYHLAFCTALTFCRLSRCNVVYPTATSSIHQQCPLRQTPRYDEVSCLVHINEGSKLWHRPSFSTYDFLLFNPGPAENNTSVSSV